MKLFRALSTPVGPLVLTAEEGALTALRFGAASAADIAAASLCGASRSAEADIRLLAEAERQLRGYFAGRLRRFDLPLRPSGTPFQQAVWEALRTIPWGEVRTYGAIAAQIGRPRACRAVGMANHCNPIAIIVPCHRVVGNDGSLTGYAGGLDIKRRLLALEAR